MEYRNGYNFVTEHKKEYNVITEFKNNRKLQSILIWIYTLPVKNIETKHSENYAIVQELKKLNDNKNIVFNEYIIASFDKIKNWGKYEYIHFDYRAINPGIPKEKRVLERLLLCEIKNSIDKNKYEIRGNANSYVYLKQPVYASENLIVRRKISFDININKVNMLNSNINKDGIGDISAYEIIVGFYLCHDFEYYKTLDEEIRDGNVCKCDNVRDFYKNISYKYIGIAPFTISQENTYMNTSIVNYYIKKGEPYVISGLDPNTKAVLVEKQDGQVFPYIPNRLKKQCTFGNLSSHLIVECNKYIKNDCNGNMQKSIELISDILKNCEYVNFDKRCILTQNLGYKKYIINRPQFEFGNRKFNSNIMYGLKQGGSYQRKSIDVSYFIDPSFFRNNREYSRVLKFKKELKSYSNKLGIEINERLIGKEFKEICIDNETMFETSIRTIVENYKHATMIIMQKKYIDKYYNLIKKVFGCKNNIATQFVAFETLNYNEKSKDAIFLNILLGIYGKSGIQPWVLAKELKADCYIGLDVSRENKLNTAGIVQIVGNDGRILKSKSVTSSQSGEKIREETLKDIFFDAQKAYEDMYHKPLKHIVFHRDGIAFEDLEQLKQIANELKIKLEYIEVTKNVKRRIAKFDERQRVWKTEIGTCIVRGNEAYIITTNPHRGMAQPLRIRKIYGEQNMREIIEDIYKLSFMHIGSIMKARLPVTTHYADLSSTYGNRDLMPRSIDSNILHFI